ncbi:hypothetical protein ACHAWO_012895 [Cyclotella atomus]|jgi:hypothetical protein|uniref:PRA1 family protein n=1 Tax=Cyclotella atomus TaxID=382360 RepID=A0ABD3NQH7_9STRA
MTTPTIGKKEPFLSIKSWDDFLDFSRMSIPVNQEVLLKRWLENVVRWSGNYLAIWIVITLAWGVFLNVKILAAFTLVASCGFCGKMFFVEASMAEASLRTYKKDDSSSDEHWFMAFGVLVMYAFSCLYPITLTFIATSAIASAHSIMRPVINEYYFLNQPKPKTVPNVVHEHSDGYVDNAYEDEVVFGKENDDPNTNIRRRTH